MFKTGLTIARFQNYVPMIEEETHEYFKRWGDAGEKGTIITYSVLKLTYSEITLNLMITA